MNEDTWILRKKKKAPNQENIFIKKKKRKEKKRKRFENATHSVLRERERERGAMA